MIFDSIVALPFYEGLHPGFSEVRKFISGTNLKSLPAGRHPINENGIYASVSEYMTKPIDECFIECHRKFIDIQIVVWGEEMIGIAPKHTCIEQDYDETKDLQKLLGKVDFITLSPGIFVIFFPQDAHEPNVRSGPEAVSVKKIVFKIPV